MNHFLAWQFPLKLFRRSKKFIDKMIWILTRQLRSFRTRPIKGEIQIEANVLVVKDQKYVRVAKVCIESFCFFNPNGIVRVHTDNQTRGRAESFFKSLIKKQRVILVDVINSDQKWQIQKLDLICSLSGSNEIFMDADLRWNAPMPQIQGTAFFVNEYKIDENEEYRNLLRLIFSNKDFFGSMKNTSFFSWGNFQLEEVQMHRIYEIENCIYNFLKLNQSESRITSEVLRMSEQLALSLAVEEFPNIEISFLKIKDGFKDGSFVESSYFGATGASF